MSTRTVVRDPQQAKALSVLRRAQGAEVTYDELRDAGIEYPASVISELELAGLPVERCYTGRWLQRASCRLVPQRNPPAAGEQTPPAVGAGTAWGPVHVYGRRSGWRPSIPTWRSGWRPAIPAWRPSWRPPTPAWPWVSPGRLLSGLALLAAVVIVAVLVLSSLGSGAPPAAHRAERAQVPSQPAPAPRHIAPPPSPHVRHRPSHHAAPPQAPPPAPPTPAALEARGHALLDAGQYAIAIPVLREAVSATGESASGCAQATSQDCLTYAFALYDLGRALRLSGNPAAAVPILQLRLRIDNQRGAVAQELALAQGSSSPASASALEARGHQLLASGQYTSAISILQQAVQATGESPGACAAPTSQTCLTYAYALYDLGRALRLSGDPQAAVPILKQRLEINDARGVVAQELRLAESGASG